MFEILASISNIAVLLLLMVLLVCSGLCSSCDLLDVVSPDEPIGLHGYKKIKLIIFCHI